MFFFFPPSFSFSRLLILLPHHKINLILIDFLHRLFISQCFIFRLLWICSSAPLKDVQYMHSEGNLNHRPLTTRAASWLTVCVLMWSTGVVLMSGIIPRCQTWLYLNHHLLRYLLFKLHFHTDSDTNIPFNVSTLFRHFLTRPCVQWITWAL